MDTVLILLIVWIIAAIAYTLSRPLIHVIQGVPDISTDYKHQYQAVLDQIMILERLCDSAGNPNDMLDQLEEKRAQAAELFSLINPQFDDVPDETTDDDPTIRESQAEYSVRSGLFYCPQCGGQVKAGDKFCTHCGHRLQP